MHRQNTSTFKLFITAGTALLAFACSDDTDDGRRGNNGGTGGSAMGTGADGGSGGSMAGSGGGMNGGTGGMTGGPPPCSGCVQLDVVVDGPAQQAQFLFRPAATSDFTGGMITWRVRALTPADEISPDRMFVTLMIQNGAPNYPGLFQPQVFLTPESGFTDTETWVDVTMDLTGLGGGDVDAGAPADDAGVVADAGPGLDAGGVAAGDAGSPDAGDAGGDVVTPPPVQGGFDITQVFQWGIQVGVDAAFIGAGTVSVAVDSVTYSGIDPAIVQDVDFTTGLDGLLLDNYMVPGTTGGPIHHP